MYKYRIAEKFISINGEGRHAGQLAVFIRFCGCNLRCSYCDTAWAWEDDAPGELLSQEEICAYISQSGIRRVTLTGGEPLRQAHILELLQELAALPIQVEIETNGSQPLAPVLTLPNRPELTVDYKLPGSGMEAHMHKEELALLDKRDVVKFVCSDKDDLQRALAVMQELKLAERTNVYLSAVWGKLKPADIVDFMRENCLNGVNLQLQLHKFIWPPDTKGV